LGFRLGSLAAPRLVYVAAVASFVSGLPSGSTHPPLCTGHLLQYPILHRPSVLSILTDVEVFGRLPLGSNSRCLRTSRGVPTVRCFDVFPPKHGIPYFRQHTEFCITRNSVFPDFRRLSTVTRNFVFSEFRRLSADTRNSVAFAASASFRRHTELRRHV
jgi:hypothetical protein